MIRHPRPAPTPPRPRFLLLVAATLASAAGCATTAASRSDTALIPTRYSHRIGPFLVFTHRQLDAAGPPLDRLAALERDVETTLGLSAANAAAEQPIEVYILDDRGKFDHFLRTYFPALPSRRAFFLAQPPVRVVYAYFDDQLGTDLRHEATHALLNAAVGDIPLWLDEGLAEYFELAPGRHGVHDDHLARLPGDLAEGWQPDLARLESLANVREMTTRDYRESWLWVHYLLHGNPRGRAALLAYLADPRGLPLSARLAREGLDDPRKVLGHLNLARSNPLAFAPPPPARPLVVRAQSEPADAEAALASRRPGFFGRIFGGMFGSGRERDAEPPPRARRARVGGP